MLPTPETPESEIESSTPILREAIVADVPEIYRMLRASAAEQGALDELCVDEQSLREDGFGTSPRYQALVAEMDGEPVAVALYFFTYSTWSSRNGLFLEDMYVRPAFRKQGVGKALMRRLIEIAHERGCRRFHWFVLRANRAAVCFYESLGGEEMLRWMPMSLREKRLTGEETEKS